ncbi:MAG: GPR endopeptidase [Clostridia bacterium]|nr:GPR endopeptidase [Clostridia bacterium]
MNYRTDLAIECNEILREDNKSAVQEEKISRCGVEITRIKVENDEQSKSLSKPLGTYITAQVEPFAQNAELFDGRLDVISDEISSLLPKDGLVLVAGLGNEEITPDALGPRCMDFLLATRHISSELAKDIGFEKMRPVAAVVPGVLGKTGIESCEILCSIARHIKPSAVITVDALAARSLSRLGNTVQISNSGISPGSGVGNARKGIDKQLLGAEVISIGVPTVVDAQTLAKDIVGKDGDFSFSSSNKSCEQTIVTPSQIDLLVERAAKLVAMAINHALQPDMKCEDIFSLVT